MRSLRWLAALALAAAACGDDGGNTDPQIDAPMGPDVDAPPQARTFTAYVIDLVQNQTAANTDPRAYTEFSDLMDPDTNNPAAYNALFN